MYDPMGESYNDYDEREVTGGNDGTPCFWGFTLSGSVSLEELACFYGLKVPGLEPRITLASYLGRNGDGSLHPGYRVTLGGAALRVLEMADGAVRKVGLELRPTRLHQPQRRGFRQRRVA
ncbi:MAG: hypothetical protein K0R53_373 [Burkholderiales bacterium]|nr:hypothetical protein [Burkholderiales bacterium]